MCIILFSEGSVGAGFHMMKTERLGLRPENYVQSGEIKQLRGYEGDLSLRFVNN